MALITQIIGRPPTPTEIATKKTNIQAVINANEACRRAINELVGEAVIPPRALLLDDARIDAIKAVMSTNFSFAQDVDKAGRS